MDENSSSQVNRRRLGPALRVKAPEPSPTSAPPDLAFDAEVFADASFTHEGSLAASAAERLLRVRSQSANAAMLQQQSMPKLSGRAVKAPPASARHNPIARQERPASARVPNYLKPTSSRCASDHGVALYGRLPRGTAHRCPCSAPAAAVRHARRLCHQPAIAAQCQRQTWSNPRGCRCHPKLQKTRSAGKRDQRHRILNHPISCALTTQLLPQRVPRRDRQLVWRPAACLRRHLSQCGRRERHRTKGLPGRQRLRRCGRQRRISLPSRPRPLRSPP